MNWFATHRIVCAEKPERPESIEVMAMDLGADHPGRGRYALYTREQWEAEAEADWTLDTEGRLWFKDGPLPGDVAATLESVWE